MTKEQDLPVYQILELLDTLQNNYVEMFKEIKERSGTGD